MYDYSEIETQIQAMTTLAIAIPIITFIIAIVVIVSIIKTASNTRKTAEEIDRLYDEVKIIKNTIINYLNSDKQKNDL